jgi:cytochrome c-type biogenesis protein CcmH/NrfG
MPYGLQFTMRFLLLGRVACLSVPVGGIAAILLIMTSVSLEPAPVHAATLVPRDGPTEEDLETEFRRAREALRKETKASDAAAHFRLGETFHHRGDLTGAVEEFHTAIRLKPDFADAYRSLGVVLLDRHDWVDAVSALRAVIALQAEDARTYYWLGRGLMAVGDWPAAAAALQKTTELSPDDAEAYADLGLVWMAQGNPSGAADALRRSVSLKPDNADTHSLLETVLAHQDDVTYIAASAQRILDRLFARE